MNISDLVAIIGFTPVTVILLILLFSNFTTFTTTLSVYSLHNITINELNPNEVAISSQGFAIAYVIKPDGKVNYTIVELPAKVRKCKDCWVIVIGHSFVGCLAGKEMKKAITLRFFNLPEVGIPKGARICDEIATEPKPVRGTAVINYLTIDSAVLTKHIRST